ncbi:TPA: hypothetical protein EYM26_03895 [Candidatus Poribacteria bacterium]|nr:hypothetical protein [Candidatus Poribacteria bacterium]
MRKKLNGVKPTPVSFGRDGVLLIWSLGSMFTVTIFLQNPSGGRKERSPTNSDRETRSHPTRPNSDLLL